MNNQRNANDKSPTPQSAKPNTEIADLKKNPGIKTSMAASHYFGAGIQIFLPTGIFSGTKSGFAFKIWSTVTLMPFSRYASEMVETVSPGATV